MWKRIEIELPKKSGMYLVTFTDYAMREFERGDVEIRYFSLKHNKFDVGYVSMWHEIPARD